jgi:5'-nucleotidase
MHPSDYLGNRQLSFIPCNLHHNVHDTHMRNSLLLCNDDGIHAEGISHLYHTLRGSNDCKIIAPDRERSAAGHAITLTDPIKTKEIYHGEDSYGLAASGTPADCIKLALCHLYKENPPALVVSGINLGSNLGISVLYSGTVSAASEAVVLGVPGVAISLCTYENPHWETAAYVADEVTKRLLEDPLPSGVLLNVNVPNLPLNALKGLRTAHMGKSRFIERFNAHHDPQGNLCYWLDGDMQCLEDDPNADVHVVQAGYASLTPIHINLTAQDSLDQLARWNTDYPP